MHIFRWDVDKTYLETSFSSFRGLLRTALETAEEKENVPGSASLLRALIRCNTGCRVTVISGSPTQMRSVLEEKFAIDGVEIDELILKDNLRNIRKGRFKAVTNQIGYKLPALFEQRKGLGAKVTETLFGDDTEADALIYALYAHALSGQIGPHEIAQVMHAMDTPKKTIQHTLEALKEAGEGDVVERVFIRIHRGLKMRSFRKLGPNIIPVFSWFQAALVLFVHDRLDADGLMNCLESCIASGNLSSTQVGFLVQDLVRRGALDLATLIEKSQGLDQLNALRVELIQIQNDLGSLQALPQLTPDYLGFVNDIQHHN